MKNILKEDRQLSFEEFLGKDIPYFNKDMDTKDTHHIRERAVEHDEECECTYCIRKELLK